MSRAGFVARWPHLTAVRSTALSTSWIWSMDRLAPAVVRAVLHRNRQSSRVPGRLHGASRRRMGDAAGAARRMDALPGRPSPIRDHDRKFTSRFDVVFEAQGTRIVRTPIQVPEANGIAERFVRTVRSECLDWLLILNAGDLMRTLTVFIDHYNGCRPHRSLGLKPPNGRTPIENWEGIQTDNRETSRPSRRPLTRV